MDDHSSDILDGGAKTRENLFHLPNVIKKMMIKYLERVKNVFGSWKFK